MFRVKSNARHYKGRFGRIGNTTKSINNKTSKRGGIKL